MKPVLPPSTGEAWIARQWKWNGHVDGRRFVGLTGDFVVMICPGPPDGERIRSKLESSLKIHGIL
jgi:hypothetical protein